MKSTHYSLCSNAYRANIFAGFSQLQQQEEFVDLILAADGHLVQVHRNLIALASPYLREILKSMPHQSPVIFLNNVSYDILTYLLNYIYLGEVKIPVQSVNAFIEVSKSLHITGIEDLDPPPKIKLPPKLPADRRKPESMVKVAINTQLDNNNIQQLTDIENNENSKLEHKELIENQNLDQDIINNAKFIIQQDDSYVEQTQSCNLLENVSLLHINNENNVIDTGTSRNIHTDQNETSLDAMPIIEIKNNQELQESTTFKIVVKTSSDSNAERTNMPQLEIQPIIATQDPITPQMPYDTTNQVKDKSTSQNHCIQNMNMTESNMNFQENPSYETFNQIIQAGTKQSLNENKLIKVLDKVVIKPGVNLLEAGDTSNQILNTSLTDCNMDMMKHMAQFSISERGALQMILNRFIYCCHNTTRTKSRWRCIEYRRSACKAYVDTVNGAIVTRNGMHAHPYHDNKIYKKHKKGLIFPALQSAMNQRDSKEKERLKTLSIEEIDDVEFSIEN